MLNSLNLISSIFDHITACQVFATGHRLISSLTQSYDHAGDQARIYVRTTCNDCPQNKTYFQSDIYAAGELISDQEAFRKFMYWQINRSVNEHYQALTEIHYALQSVKHSPVIAASLKALRSSQ